MMVKKFTALTFLLSACTIMLAFTVLPHHHHEEYICFAAAHCQHEMQNQQHSHDQDNSSDGHECVKNLLQTNISRSQNLEHLCKTGHCHHFILLHFLLPTQLVFLSYPINPPFFSHTYYREKLHDACYAISFTGRAPPKDNE